MFGEVPVLPVVVPIAVAVFAVLAWHLRRRRLLTAPRVSVALALCVYVAGVIANTVFPIFLDKPSRSAGWSDYLWLTPLAGYEVSDAVMNICVFAPIGVLLALLAPSWSWGRVLAAAALVSLAIETTQYVTAHLLAGGHVADVNDLLCNVAGAALGIGVLRALSQAPTIGRVVDRFRWA